MRVGQATASGPTRQAEAAAEEDARLLQQAPEISSAEVHKVANGLQKEATGARTVATVAKDEETLDSHRSPSKPSGSARLSKMARTDGSSSPSLKTDVTSRPQFALHWSPSVMGHGYNTGVQQISPPTPPASWAGLCQSFPHQLFLHSSQYIQYRLAATFHSIQSYPSLLGTPCPPVHPQNSTPSPPPQPSTSPFIRQALMNLENI